MDVNVRGKNIQVTQGLQEAAQKAVAKSRHFLSDASSVHVLLSAVGQTMIAEITVRDGNALARVEGSGADMYNVLHDAGETLERKLKKYKNQMVAKYEGRPTSHTVVERIGKGYEEKTDPREDNQEIVKVKHFGIKPMFPEDAVLEMELVGHDFFVFANAEENCEVNVVYRRKNGGYGLIRPEFQE